MQELRDAGYLPAAVRNYLALLGWGTEDDTTLLSTEELVERFSIERVGRSAAVFDERKLRWMNGRYMRELPLEEYERRLAEHLRRPRPRRRRGLRRRLARAPAHGLRDRAGQGPDAGRGLAADPVPVRGAGARSQGLGEGDDAGGARPRSRRRADALRGVGGFDADALEGAAGAVVERSGEKPKDVYQPIRVAITGTTVSPGIFDSLAALGREESVRRIDAAIERLGD